jgi:nicotinate phosphoribosyltransferase
MPPKQKPTSSDAKRKTDQKLDEALKDSFPSSDPVALSEPAPEEPDEDSKDKKDKERKSGSGGN